MDTTALGKYLESETENPRERGRKKGQRIITGIAKRCLQNFAAGIQSSLSSPAQKWLAFEHPDKALNEKLEVKEYLSGNAEVILDILQVSRFYSISEAVYKHLGAFGTAVVLMEECYVMRKNKKTQVARFTTLEPGEYFIGENENKDVDTLIRRYSLTAYQIVRKFGEEYLPARVQEALDKDNTETRFTIIHMVLPNNEYRAGSILPENMEYASYYFVEDIAATEKHIFLRGGEGNRQGFPEKPFAAVRWGVRLRYRLRLVDRDGRARRCQAAPEDVAEEAGADRQVSLASAEHSGLDEEFSRLRRHQSE